MHAEMKTREALNTYCNLWILHEIKGNERKRMHVKKNRLNTILRDE
jgi:hypothetical protein